MSCRRFLVVCCWFTIFVLLHLWAWVCKMCPIHLHILTNKYWNHHEFRLSIFQKRLLACYHVCNGPSRSNKNGRWPVWNEVCAEREGERERESSHTQSISVRLIKRFNLVLFLINLTRLRNCDWNRNKTNSNSQTSKTNKREKKSH